MMVPRFWAEARVQQKHQGRQLTVRRFGWSDMDQAEAQTHAQARVQDALARLLAGEKLERREPRVPYHGASGVPIREEIVSRHGEVIITRNSYGARCLNTPNTLFADIDFPEKLVWRVGCLAYLLMLVAALLAGRFTQSWLIGAFGVLVVLFVVGPLVKRLQRMRPDETPDAEIMARNRVAEFAQEHPDWSLRLYRTPAGLRVLATHRPFEPADPMVSEFFRALGADSIYALMCQNQQCFRARVSPKPWRIGIQKHMRPRPGTWPVNPERLPLRNEWIAHYETQSQNWAACRFVETLGIGVIHPQVQPVLELHDGMCRATVAGLPIA